MFHKIKKRKYDVIFCTVVGILILFEILRFGETPGIYFDAIMADYTAVQVISPQEYTALTSIGQLFNFPLIGAIYHGNLTMFGTLLMTLITGTTSVVQYHILNALWGIGIVVALYATLRLTKVSKVICSAIILLLATNSVFITSMLTQNYSFLPGALFMILSVYSLFKWKETGNKKNLFITAFWGGLSIYVYFIYLFFVPVVLLITAVYNKKKWFENYCILLNGYLSGLYFYILGFISIYLNTMTWTKNQKNVCFFVLALLLAAYILIFYYMLVVKENTKKATVISEILLIISSVTALITACLLIYPIISTKITSYNVSGNAASLSERIERMLQVISYNLSNIANETMILNRAYGILPNAWRNICIAVTIVWLVVTIYIRFKNKNAEKKASNTLALWILLLQLCFFVVSIVFATRLWCHHFFTFFVFTFFLMAYQLQVLADVFLHQKNMKKVFLAIVGACLLLNVFNLGKTTFQIKAIGGRKYFTNQTTELAKEAKQNLQNGEKEFYIFPEWGFSTSFIYLTGNTVPCSSSSKLNQEFLNEKVSEGYSIVVAFWEQENEEQYRDTLQINDDVIIEKEIWNTLNGEYAFSTLTLKD